MMMQKVRTNNKCAVNEDLLFPLVKYVETSAPTVPTIPISLTSCQKILKTELLNAKKCMEYKCPNEGCRVKTNFHPLFIQNGIAGCYLCEKVEVIVRRILESKGYSLIGIETKNGESYVTYSCIHSHKNEIRYSVLKLGKECTQCKKNDRKKKVEVKLKRKPCDCKKRGTKGKVCAHYNFAVLCPDAALDWDYCLNDVLPTEIAPGTIDEYWFRCSTCFECFEQSINSRKAGRRCPYCAGHKVSKNNNLAVTHPHLAREWNLDTNFKYCNEVTHGCGDDVEWICRIGPVEHVYNRIINTRASTHEAGCPCQDKNHAQKIGKHDYFVKICSQVHNNKYSYPERYTTSKKKMKIYCPVLSKIDNEPHGIFSQRASAHKKGEGCPQCAKERVNSKGVVAIKNILTSLGYIENNHYICEETFPGMKFVKPLRLDFYLHESRIAIEFDGETHFKSVNSWGGLDALEKSVKKDYCKDLYCLQNQISILRFPYGCMDSLTEDRLKEFIELCKKTCVYLSYSHLIEPIKKAMDVSKITVLQYNLEE